MTAFLFIVAVLQIETQKNVSQPVNPKFIIEYYNVLAMIFIARASVMVHMDNRSKFLYFQKSYGLNPIVYTLTWILYSLVLGALKFFIYTLIVYCYLNYNDDLFKQYYIGYGFPGENFFITYEQNCYVNFLAYLGVYSYCLLIAVILQYRQIGLKILSPLFIFALLCLQSFYLLFNIDLDKLTYSSPVGWIVTISCYRNQNL
jgi:hypothetical protein